MCAARRRGLSVVLRSCVVLVFGVLASGCTGGSDSAAIESSESLAADTASTVAPVPERGQQSTSEQVDAPEVDAASETDAAVQDEAEPDEARRYQSIRDVDFFNDVIYETNAGNGPTQTNVTDGSAQHGEPGDEDYYWFGITQVEFGDLDSDGVEDALVATSWNGGGTGYFDGVRAFRLVDGTPVVAGRVAFGDRADGGIVEVRITEGQPTAWAFAGGQGACCPERIVETRLVLGEHSLVVADRGPIRSWIQLESYRGEMDELKFEPGTSSGIVTIDGFETAGSFFLDAAAGQRLAQAWAGPVPDTVAVLDTVSGEQVPATADGATDEWILPSTGRYEITLGFETERTDTTMIEVRIDRGEQPASVTWVPDVDQVVLDTEPFVHTSITWPRFVSDQPGTAAANDALASNARSLDDWWVNDVVEFEQPGGDSSYEANYDVVVVTEEIVSVTYNFFDYVCCRPYPNYGQRGVVVDLRAGRVIPTGEIIDLGRLAELNEIWLAALAERERIPVDEAEVDTANNVLFDSLTVVRGGIELGTDRGSLGGGLPGTTVVVGFDELGDLINPEFAARL